MAIFSNVEHLKMWVHKILPLVYDDSMSYYETLCKVVAKLNEVVTLSNEQTDYLNNWLTTTEESLESWKSDTKDALEEKINTDLGAAIDRLETEFANELLDAEGMIYGTQNDVPVEQGSEYYENNAKYFHDQSAESAQMSKNYANGGSSHPSPIYAFDNAKYFRERAEAWANGEIYGQDVTSQDESYENNSKYYMDQAKEAALTFVPDPTLTEADRPAEAKATGDAVAELNNAANKGIVNINLSEHTDDVVPYAISSDNTVLKTSSRYSAYQISRKAYDILTVEAKVEHGTYILFLKEALSADLIAETDVSESLATGETGRHGIAANTTVTFQLPEDCTYLFIWKKSNNSELEPSAVYYKTVIKQDIENNASDISDLNDRQDITEDTISAMESQIYDNPRKNKIPGETLYLINSGYRTGDVGESISGIETNALYCCTGNRLPLTAKTRISIDNSNVYEMCVFGIAQGGDTILYKSEYTSNDILIDNVINSSNITVAVNFRRKDGATLETSDTDAVKTIFNLYYINTYRLILPTTIKIPMELGNFTSSTKVLYDQESMYSTFYKTMRTPCFLDVRYCNSFKVTSSFYSMTAVYYDINYTYISTQTIIANELHRLDHNVAFIRFVVANENNADFTHAEDYITVVCDGNAKIVKAIDNNHNSVDMRFCYVVGGQTGRDYSDSTAQVPELTDTVGIVRLPPNYDNTGDPVPLIVYAHGSSDYEDKWQAYIRGEVGNREVIEYLVNEGYAVFDCFGHTEAANVPDGKGHTYGSVDCINCYIAGIRRLMKVYNLRTDGIYVTGISSGGLTALNLAFNNTIPVLACTPLAPAISIFNRFLGYTEQQRKEYAWAMGFEGNTDVLVGRNSETATVNSEPAYTQDLIDYYTINASKVVGYNPMWNGIVNVSMSTLISQSIEPNDADATRLAKGDRTTANWTNAVRVCKTPMKIWIADDDHNVPPSIIHNFLTSLKNGQNIAEERLVPNGQGGHYAFTSSNTTERTSGITSLGVAYTNIPIYWLEMVAFFKRF